MTPEQERITADNHKKEELRIRKALRPFLAKGVRVSAPHVPAGDGITLRLGKKSVDLYPVGDDMTFLEVTSGG